MSCIIQDILVPGLQIDQEIRIERNTNLRHIRAWIYVQGTLVDGDLKMTVLQGATELATSQINYVDINDATSDTYSHGFIRFDFDSLQLNVAEGNDTEDYVIRLEMINHSLDTSNFVAWNRRWDDKLYDNYGDVDGSGDPVNDMVAPFGLELYEWRSI